MADESYEEENDYSYDANNYSGEGNAAVMKNFFDVQRYITKKISYWQGYTIVNGKKIETHDPVAPDSFIYSAIGLIDSVVTQHNSVSFTNEDKASRILYESIFALNVMILDEPFFNQNRYKTFIEEFDHTLELFMGLIINGHGKMVATALQAGVVHENQPVMEKRGFLDRFK